ncbi:MAG TPA: hypothetical protein DCR93_28475, partial [Cytophagales bacterium]|nr:hypothetical protein [Cytophagales bacterium]
AMSNLKGLEEGYRTLYRELHQVQGVTKAQLHGFRRKTRSIMVKSYLGGRKPIAALAALLKRW